MSGTTQSYTIFYKTDTDPQPEGYSGTERGGGTVKTELRAIDVKTGKIAWKHATNNGAQTLLTTAGNLLFGSDGSGNFIAFDARNGEPLWHAGSHLESKQRARSLTCSTGISMFS